MSHGWKEDSMLVKRKQHVPIYLQPFPSNSTVRHFSTFLHILSSPEYAPGTIAINVTRLERGFNACTTPRCIYPSIFNHFWDRVYSKLLVENCDIFIPHLCLAPPQGWPRLNFAQILYMRKTRMNVLSCGEENMTIQPFWYNTSVLRTDGETDRQKELLYQYRASADAR